MKPIPMEAAGADGASAERKPRSDRSLIEMPMVAHARCLAKLGEKSPEYALLMSGIVLRDDPAKLVVRVRCDAHQLQVIRNLLARECPEILDETRVYPDPA